MLFDSCCWPLAPMGLVVVVVVADLVDRRFEDLGGEVLAPFSALGDIAADGTDGKVFEC
jgi:hypothetical protein